VEPTAPVPAAGSHRLFDWRGSARGVIPETAWVCRDFAFILYSTKWAALSPKDRKYTKQRSDGLESLNKFI
jgi:hypothetical protein